MVGANDTACRGALFAPVLVLSALTALLARTGGGQEQAAGVFRGNVTLVPIDVRVVDRSGKPIVDLNQSDFVVLEDGAQQTIRHFERRLVSTEAPAANQTPNVQSSDTLTPIRHRSFLIVLERLWLPTLPFAAGDALVRFVRHDLLPRDFTSFCAWQRAVEFTTDHEQVAQVIERFQQYQRAIDANNDIEKRLALFGYLGKPIPAKVDAELDTIFAGPYGHLVRRVPLVGQMVTTGHLEQEIRDQNSVVEPLRSSSNMQANSLARITAGRLDVLLAGIRYMRDVEGERHLILITPRIGFPSEEDARTVARTASDARVALDIVVVSTPESGVRWSGTDPSIRMASEMTGGVAAIGDYVDVALRRIDEVTKQGYVLGYYPSNHLLDGRYRTISVRVIRPAGARVLCRNGYYARAELAK